MEESAGKMQAALKTRTVFLTGGAKGLGKGFCEALLARGARVVFGDVDRSVGNVTEAEWQTKYGKDSIKFIPFDVTDGDKFEEAFQAATQYLGHVDLMVNNAGIVCEDRWEQTIQTNFIAVVKGTYLAMQHMRRDKGGKGGKIINMSSVAGLDDRYIAPVYSGAKHAVRAFTTSLAMAPDVKEQGIQFGVLCPDATSTDLLKDLNLKLRYFETLNLDPLSPDIATVDRVAEGFMKLLELEDMNGAIMQADVMAFAFYKMEKVNLGNTWPVTTSTN